MKGTRRVVVTGLGMLTPVGNNVQSSWSNMLAGRSGVGPIVDFDAEGYPSRIAGHVKNFDPEPALDRKAARKNDIFIQYGLVAGYEAFADSALEVTEANAHRIGVAIGSGIGGISMIENTHKITMSQGPKRVSPFYIPGAIINMVSGNLSINLGLKGPNVAVVTACTTGTHNIGLAARSIVYGDADVMLAGGAEKASTPTGMAGFAAARALSRRNDEPEKASRPWDQDRDGFVLGDGAGVLVLEEYEHAKARGARIYAELKGFGMSADAHHITAPSETGQGAYDAMKNALNDAGVDVNDVGYINAHGTSTPVGDELECLAVKRLLGDAAYKIPISSTKSMIGHLLGASGAVEAIATIKALCDQVVPPTINLDNPSSDCDLDFVPHVSRDHTFDIALSNSFGFGGTNGTLIFARV